jgi:pyrimidine-specific ribonucleoside hydrolase|tara:strand:- start:6174 stop:7124 length:951 start_codon:yes stop_codon:yes gene_type:complete
MIPRNIFLDVDTGVDDALALLLAARSPNLNIKGVTCVSGNVPVDLVVRNTLDVLEAAGASHVPVARGMDVPLLETMVNAAEIHGKNGLGGIELAKSASEPLNVHAVEFLRRELTDVSDSMTIVALGPLTNIATLIRAYPEVVSKIDEIVVMGGAIGPGNVTPTAEFNIRQDPEAADIVFGSGIPILLYIWDVFIKVAFVRSEIESFSNSSNNSVALAGNLLMSMLDRFGRPETSIGDAGAVACILNANAITAKQLPVAVELSGKYTRGQTVVDQRPPDLADLEEGDLQVVMPNTIRVVVDVDVNGLRDTFVEHLGK